MNKSIITNLTSTLSITIDGVFSPVYAAEIFMAGLFGLSGGLTNWLAIHMLFEKIPFLVWVRSNPAYDSKNSKRVLES